MAPSIAPARVAIVGAGMVGLSVAWFLQQHDVSVTVLESDEVGAAASWGNAGWLTPSLATPLPEPGVLAYGLRAVLSPSSPVYVAPTLDPRLLSFVARFARNSTRARWRSAMAALVPMNRLALAAFDTLAEAGVSATTLPAEPFTAAYRTVQERDELVAELEEIRAAGQEVAFEVLNGEDARAAEPTLSPQVAAAVQLHAQRYIDPGAFTQGLAQAVRDRGGTIREGVTVGRVMDTGREVLLSTAEETLSGFDGVVVATGTWLGELMRPQGVRRIVQAGRGYSFSVPVTHQPRGPVYLPTQRVACTPIGDRLRVAGMMEFRRPEAPLDARRVAAIVNATRPLLAGVDLDDRRDEWVGSRPCTADGLPLIGRTRSPRVLAAGGHGMWGMTLGPATGQLLARLLTTGEVPPELSPFDPMR